MVKVKEASWDIIVAWLFSTQGVIVANVALAAIMPVLVCFTKSLKPYAPVSYYLAFLLGVILVSLIFKLLNRRSKISTFIEYDMINGEIKISKASNMLDQRTFTFPEYNVGLLAVFVTFRMSIYPSSLVDVISARGNPPKVYRQYIGEKGVVLFLSDINPNCTFRLVFNKNYES